MKEPIFTIKTFEKGNVTFYFDLMSDYTFSVFKDEKVIINSKNPQVCITKLKEKGFKIG